ncbi:DUF7619 domain-containing protein [Flavobacterium selenitireducens]|uniref:DUF7619 domain-containing protein n=1 Tax=Flavobacterium selenitireducens TaxID=2722704 RepID=UPI00168AB41C|nr:T9SS type A sorting domain-containing protein [Flavobacterium selenitireducens]MBD3583485.1 T9SS type A sorting domain-containing protein [Flavobacterium selenitireducens]
MKQNYWLLFICLTVMGTKAQVVTFADPVFKQNILFAFDANHDGEIQDPEELGCDCQMFVDDPNITDLTGIERLHVSSWEIRNTAITSVAISNNGFLAYLQLWDNPLLQSVNVSGNDSFTSLTVDDSPLLNALDLTGTDIYVAQLFNTGLVNLDFSAFSGFGYFRCQNNQQLQSVTVNSGPFVAFECENNPNLTTLNTMNSAFLSVEVSHNALQSLTLNEFDDVDASFNALTEIDFQTTDPSAWISLASNNLTDVDLSRCVGLSTVYLSNNQLQTVNIKNGNSDSSLVLHGNPDIEFICADAGEESMLHESIQSAGLSNVVVNGYCSFTPGGNFNTIEGSFSHDADANGCDASDLKFAHSKIVVTQGSTTESVFTDSNGHYNFYTNTGDFTLTPFVENPSYFNVNPASATVNFAGEDGSVEVRDFCVTANGIHPDAEIILNGSMPEPGFDTNYAVTLRNKGNQVLSGTATVNFDDSRLDYVSSNPDANADAGSVSWNYTNLQPFETRQYLFVLNVNSPMETPAVNIGDILPFTASAIVASDETQSDNTFAFSQEVFGSYDPNDITCLEGGIVSPTKIGEYLHYLIRFENTGNANAHNIVVKNAIDATKFDVSSLQIQQSSGEMVTRITGNEAEFLFEGIELGAGQHGYLLYKIKTLSTLVENSSVMAFADIFFDYNFPVTTNEAETVFQQLSVGEVSDVSISVFPNPTTDIVTVRAASELKSVEVFDARGRLLLARKVNSGEVAIDLSDKNSGMYFIRTTSEKGSSVVKLARK